MSIQMKATGKLATYHQFSLALSNMIQGCSCLIPAIDTVRMNEECSRLTRIKQNLSSSVLTFAIDS